MEFYKEPKEIVITRSLFLRGIALIYLISNLSIYSQIQGLFGDEGLSPVKNFMKKLHDTYKENSGFVNFPTLLHFSSFINEILTFSFSQLKQFSPEENTLHFLCLISIIIATSICLNLKWFYNSFGFFLLWLNYLSFYIIGQTFISHQWDLLLLETGFLAIIFCPFKHSDLCTVSYTQLTVYYILRFLMFRVTFSNGVLKILSGCQFWSNLDAFNHFFQSTPSPHIFSYLLHNTLPYNLKRILVAFIYVVEIYVPFFFFNLALRRLTIFSGALQYTLHIFYFFSGNFNFFPLLMIIINLSNFDDEFLLSILPNFLLKKFKMDYGKVEVLQKSEGDLIREQREKILGKPVNTVDNSKDNMTNTGENKEEDIRLNSEASPRSTKPSPFIYELITFFNCLSILLFISFIYFFPIHDLLKGQLKIYSSIFLKNILNVTYFSYFIIAVYFFIVLKFSFNNFEFFSEELKKLKYRRGNNKYLKFTLDVVKTILFILFLSIYFLSALSSLYTDLKLKLSDPLVIKGIQISDLFTKRFHISNNYGLFKRIKGVSGRLDLEFYYKQKRGEWIVLETFYNRDLEILTLPSFSHSRLAWKLANSPYSQDINDEPYLALLAGKLLEKNPVILNLLGFRTKRSDMLEKHSLINKLFPSYITFPLDIESIKIEKIKLIMNTKEDYIKRMKFWKKSVFNSFLKPVKLESLKGVFEHYEIPLKTGRDILISPFEMLNINEIILFIISLYIVTVLLRN